MAAATVSANIFSKCLPAFGTDIKQCGTVTVCDVQTPTEAELAGIFMSGGNYRVMDALLVQDFEIKMCGTVTNGLYDFLMANKVDMSKRLSKVDLGSGRFMVMPFIQALQKSRINNEFWQVSAGQSTRFDTNLDTGADWYIKVTSTSSMPADTRWFNTRMRVYIRGVSAGGTATVTAWRVDSKDAGGPNAKISGSEVWLGLISENDNSNLSAAKTPTTSAGWPTAGILVRGTPNVNSYEEWCEEGPGLNTNKLVPYWIEEVRNSLCTSELYEKYRDMIIDSNPYYAKFADVTEVEKNQQLGADWQRRVVNTFWHNKPLANQDLTNWRSLEQITTASSSLDLPDEGTCVGYRANAIGVYEQLAACSRVKDLQGQVLNLQELFKALYQIQRAREALNEPSDVLDAFTDSEYAAKIQRAMIRYFKMQSEDTMSMNVDITKAPTQAKFGFRYNSYVLDWPVMTLNIVSHKYFDDQIAAAKLISTTHATANRFLWIIDFAQIYPGIIASERVVNETGDLAKRAAVDSSYMCVMKVPTRKQTLTSMTYTVVVECSETSLILENISSDYPEHRNISADGDYSDLYGSYA